jgi:hypothetical protein
MDKNTDTATSPDIAPEPVFENSEAHRAEHAKMEAAATRSAVRSQIAETAGDTESLLGATSDVLQLVLYHFSAMAAGLTKATNMQQVNAAAEPFYMLTQNFTQSVDGGQVKLTFNTKGVKEVLRDVGVRSTAICTVISPPKPPKPTTTTQPKGG